MSIKTSLLILSLLSSTLWVTEASANVSSEQSIQPQTITLKLQNMTCALCPITIKKALQEVKGVQQVIVDFDTKTAAITFDSNITDSDALIKATTNAGYPSAIAASNVQ
jgi:periplasmic mercuric ion binding protein